MSHHATNWAILQRGLKPATKIVLWHLCDRHNPDFGCFPTQVRLAADAEMSVSSLNEHLAKLEAACLIRRIRAHDPHTHRRQATRYILGFEADTPPDPEPEIGDGRNEPNNGETDDPSPESGHGAISGKSAKPSPDFAHFHLRNPETNLVREPLREPVKEEDARAREAVSDEFFGKLLGALGFATGGALPAWWQGWPPREHVRRWRDDLGLSEARILKVATATRRDHPAPPDGPRALDRAMERAARSEAQPEPQGDKRRKRGAAPKPTEEELAGFYAGLVNADGYLPPSAITNRVREVLLARGLVTPERLRMRGVL